MQVMGIVVLGVLVCSPAGAYSDTLTGHGLGKYGPGYMGCTVAPSPFDS